MKHSKKLFTATVGAIALAATFSAASYVKDKVEEHNTRPDPASAPFILKL